MSIVTVKAHSKEPWHCRRRREESLTGPRRFNKTRAAKNRLETPHVVSYNEKGSLRDVEVILTRGSLHQLMLHGVMHQLGIIPQRHLFQDARSIRADGFDAQ